MRTGTPIPKRETEMKARGSGPVITYRLSPEGLERVRRGERLEKKEEQTMSTTTEAPKTPDKMEVLRRLAAGWKIARIEEELGMTKGALQYWLGKWDLKGVKGEQAQQLLDELLIDQRAEYVPVDPKPLKSSELVQEQVKDELIERLKKELAEKTTRINELEAANVRAVALAGQAAEKQLAEIEQLREERDALLQTVERAVDDGRGREVSSTEAIEAATTGLTGGLAYHTGAAIERLWRWQTVEDLRLARRHIDRLVESVVVEETAG